MILSDRSSPDPSPSIHTRRNVPAPTIEPEFWHSDTLECGILPPQEEGSPLEHTDGRNVSRNPTAQVGSPRQRRKLMGDYPRLRGTPIQIETSTNI